MTVVRATWAVAWRSGWRPGLSLLAFALLLLPWTVIFESAVKGATDRQDLRRAYFDVASRVAVLTTAGLGVWRWRLLLLGQTSEPQEVSESRAWCQGAQCIGPRERSTGQGFKGQS